MRLTQLLRDTFRADVEPGEALQRAKQVARLAMHTYESAVGLGVECWKGSAPEGWLRPRRPDNASATGASRAPAMPRADAHAGASATPPGRGVATESTTGRTPERPVLALEAVPGEVGQGAFMVANRLTHAVKTQVVVSELVSRDGRVLREVRVDTQPRDLALGPGEEVVVRVAARLPTDMPTDATFYGELSVRDLPGSRVRVLLRGIDPVSGQAAGADADASASSARSGR